MSAAKKKPDPPKEGAPSELAAPAVLKRLQMDAAKFSAQIDDSEERLAALQALSDNAKEAAKNKEQIARVECELITARDNFGKTAKILLSFDKGVSSERKEGEKVSVEECKEFFTQFRLSLGIARENYIIAMAQQSGDPMKFVKAHAELIRSTEDAAIESAIRESVIPKWVIE